MPSIELRESRFLLPLNQVISVLAKRREMCSVVATNVQYRIRWVSEATGEIPFHIILGAICGLRDLIYTGYVVRDSR